MNAVDVIPDKASAAEKITIFLMSYFFYSLVVIHKHTKKRQTG
jgi:hypothetical protein